MIESKFLIKAKRTDSISELIRIFDSFLASKNSHFGVLKKHRVSIDKTRIEANLKATQLLKNITNPLLVTEEEKDILRGYTGEGNIGGSTDEYYSPTWLAKGAWDLLAAYGAAKGNICEPAAGTGVFNGTKPEGVIMTATELSETSSRINQILHPEDEIRNTNFEKFAADESTDETFDAVVGNVPFGQSRGEFANDDPSYKHRTTKETYFVDRAIDKVKPKGFITLVVPQNIVSSKKLVKFRSDISRKAEFLGAHKIASGAFANQGSDSVVTDVIVLRKHSNEMAEIINETSDKDLKEANVLWATFIRGEWFKKEGRPFIHGEIAEGEANYGGDLFRIPGLPKPQQGKQLTAEETALRNDLIASHNSSTARAMSKKFESRIRWDLLEATEPTPISYMEGDSRLINNRWHEMVDGDWLPIKLSNTKGLLDSSKYGSSAISQLTTQVQNPQNALTINFEHLENINNDFPDKTQGIIRNAFNLAAKHKDGHKERIVRGVLIGSMIENYQELIKHDPSGADVLRLEIQSHLNAAYDDLGTSHGLSDLKRIRGDSTAAYYQSFVNAMTEEGEFSALIKGTLDTTSTVDFNLRNPQHVVDYVSKINNYKSISTDDFLETFEGQLPEHVDPKNENSVLDYLCDFDNVAIDNNGLITQLDRATSGNVVHRQAELDRALTNASLTEKQKLNIAKQQSLLNTKRKITPKDKIVFDMRGKWIPRQAIVEFLHDNGYDEMEYSGIEIDDDGNAHFTPGHEGTDGLFEGYYTKDGKAIKSYPDENRFVRQLEKYLNGESVRSSDGKTSSRTREKIRTMERQFNRWMKNHPDSDKFAKAYNDTFNGHVAFEHSEEPLNLKNVSGNVVNMGYQNSGIRRLSEDGRGILGFGTGLGKTFTALGLTAYNTQEGRSKRTCITVPKAVTENWINETCDFYGYNNLSNALFIGYDFELDDKGMIKTQPVLDDDGVPKTYPATGKPRTVPVLRECSAQEIADKMHRIPHSNYNLVVMTKEQFARIPMKADSIKDNAHEHMSNNVMTGKIAAFADSYKKQQAKEALLAKLTNDGYDKEFDYPYFEDMHFDTVIVDEGHNYRNSQEPGARSRQLSFLAAGTEAKIAADMRQKMQYLGRKNNGRGPILLTATPTPNSPLDIYNMLSHILTPDEWLSLGIANQDDFINVFGETSEVQLTRIDGEQVMAQGLTGFKNLDGLRALIDKHCNRKNIKDIASETRVPEVLNQHANVEMNSEQKELYEFLRLRAEVLSASKGEDGLEMLLSNSSPEKQDAILEIINTYPSDQIFSIIRDMDRVCSDPELFHGQMTFIFPKEKAANAKKMLASIVTSKKVKLKVRNVHGELENKTFDVHLNPQIKPDDNGKFIVSINEVFEPELLSALKKHSLSQSDITHPVSPKYAKLLDNLKVSYQAGGKQLIFTEEKSQHKKLHRLIAHHLGISPDEIGIMNGSTVSGAESASNKDGYKKLSAKKLKELEAQGHDVEQDGLEAIANHYNTGKFKILICNKKAEVGVNLHIGTTDIHHLTLPWNPASVDQRNGRGARVGAPQEFVNSHFYLATDSFDQFRLDTINRKRKWQDDLIDGDAIRADNSDADNENDAQLLLANNPEEYKALLEAKKKELADKVKQAQTEDANSAIDQFIDASKLAMVDISTLEARENDLIDKVSDLTTSHENAEANYIEADTEHNQNLANGRSVWWSEDNRKNAKKALNKTQKQLKEAKSQLRKIQQKTKSVHKAKKQVKQLRGQVEEILESQILRIDKSVLNSPTNCLMSQGRIIERGKTYRVKDPKEGADFIFTVKAVDNKTKMVYLEGISKRSYRQTELPASALKAEVILSTSQTEQLHKMASGISVSDWYGSLSQEQWATYLNEGLLPHDMFSLGYKNDKLVIGPVYSKLADSLVYPDRNNERLKEHVALKAIETLRTGKNIDYRLSGFCTLLLGDDYLDTMHKYDPNAETDEEIAKAVDGLDISELINQKIESGTHSSSTYQYYIERSMRGALTSKLKELELSNNSIRTKFWEQCINNRANKLSDEITSLIESRKQQDRDQRSQRAANHLNDSEDQVKMRLQAGQESISSFVHSSSFYQGFIDTMQETEYAGKPELLYIDMQRAGYEFIQLDNSFAYTFYEMCDKVYSALRAYRNNPGLLHQFLNSEIPAIDIKDDESSLPEDVDTSDIPFAKVLFDQFGIICKKNTSELEFKSFRGKVYASGQPYEYIGFFDPKGKGGQLHTALGPVKRRKNAINSKDPSPEFDGFWWFVKSDLDTNIVLDAFNI